MKNKSASCICSSETARYYKVEPSVYNSLIVYFYVAILQSLGSYRKIHSSASLSDSTEKSKKWGSFSGSVGRPSRSLSAKRKSSGFTCYLDGPEDDPALRDTPSPTLPMSPLHEVSDLARVIDSPSTDHFVPTSEQTIEMEMFWKKVAWYVIIE